MTWTGRPNTSSTTWAVTTSLGAPWATIVPARMAMTSSPYRQAWFRSWSTATIVVPSSAFSSRHSSRTSTWWARSR